MRLHFIEAGCCVPFRMKLSRWSAGQAASPRLLCGGIRGRQGRRWPAVPFYAALFSRVAGEMRIAVELGWLAKWAGVCNWLSALRFWNVMWGLLLQSPSRTPQFYGGKKSQTYMLQHWAISLQYIINVIWDLMFFRFWILLYHIKYIFFLVLKAALHFLTRQFLF